MKEILFNLFDRETSQMWTLRILKKGMKYGRKMCLTHDKDKPIVEFYDANYTGEMMEKFAKNPDGELLGQFVSRYYIETLLGNDGGDPIGTGRGLCLDGGVDKWNISESAMNTVAEFLESYNSIDLLESLNKVKECLDYQFQFKDELIPEWIVEAYNIIEEANRLSK